LKQTHRAYERARERVLAAQTELATAFKKHKQTPGSPEEDEPPDVAEARRHVGEAHEELRAAEGAISGDELEAAWEQNRAAVTDARHAVVDALRQQARIETECGNTARRRSPRFPVLNDDERQRVTQARAGTNEARQRHRDAVAQFKLGVTAEQLEG
jgi:hypothetical protein